MPRKTNRTRVPDAVIQNLAYFLADSFVLYVKTLNFHWNLVGEEFYMYHKLLEEQYTTIVEGIDEIAERIRMLGAIPPSSMREFLEIAKLKEANPFLNDFEMISELTQDHRELSFSAKHLINISDKHNDQGTSDLIIERMRFHDKSAWILSSHLKGRKQ